MFYSIYEGMSEDDSMQPTAFDIETTGFDGDAVITVAGLAYPDATYSLVLHVGEDLGSVSKDRIEETVQERSGHDVSVILVGTEAALIKVIDEVMIQDFDEDAHYLAAFNGERWRGGFDIPFLRRRCIETGTRWVFRDTAYCDVMDMVDRINTEADDLVGAYDELLGREHCDPFESSEEAVTAWERGDWVDLLLHNLADIRRTRELAELATGFVPRSDFGMKNLAPP